MRAVFRVIGLIGLLFLAACSSAPPRPPAAQPAPQTPVEETVSGTVSVTASSLNVRQGASASDPVVTRVRRGTRLDVLGETRGWLKVRLATGEIGWVSAQHVSRDGATRRAGCPPNSDYSFIKTPTPSFPQSEAHGLVIVEATVNTRGEVTGTKLVLNSTGDPALAALTEREIRSATFKPPVVNCVTRSFIFTYKRSF